MTIGWKLDASCREKLLRRFPPRYPQVVADHVTRKPGPSGGKPPPPVTSARIVGRADDCEGVEAYVVAIDGSTRRPDGGTWHVTWSLADGRTAKESNHVIARLGWEPFDGGALVLIPAAW